MHIRNDQADRGKASRAFIYALHVKAANAGWPRSVQQPDHVTAGRVGSSALLGFFKISHAYCIRNRGTDTIGKFPRNRLRLQ